MLNYDQIAVLVSRLVYALKDRGYQATTASVKILINELLREFGGERLSFVSRDELETMKIYIDSWGFSPEITNDLKPYKAFRSMQ